MIETVYQNYSVTKLPEITLEANPDDLLLDHHIFESYKSIGINRLSIGVQSFFDSDLKLMNRAHSGIDALQSLFEASKYFKNISIDLIYGVQGASNNQWIQNIEIALSFNPVHISSYALTVEPKTALASMIKKGVVNNVDDTQAQEQFLILKERLEDKGYIHYELSNFGKEGYFSQNNSAYWQGKPYIGIGPSAHSFNGNERLWNVKNNSTYIKSIQDNHLPVEKETLTKTDRYNEYIMTGLRTMWGVSFSKILSDFGKSYLTYLQQQAQPYIEEHLLYIDNDCMYTTKKGLFLSDGIASDLFMLNLKS